MENVVNAIKNYSKELDFDTPYCPNLFPPLAVLASFAQGESKILSVSYFKHKESNRANTIQSELTKMGAIICISGDEMLIQGIEIVNSVEINPNGDH